MLQGGGSVSVWHTAIPRGDMARHCHVLTYPILLQVQQLIVKGELPCSKEEAASLSGIQLHLEETWPDTAMS